MKGVGEWGFRTPDAPRNEKLTDAKIRQLKSSSATLPLAAANTPHGYSTSRFRWLVAVLACTNLHKLPNRHGGARTCCGVVQ
eukprot:COSAG01_NODE_4422_length_5037_cov_79.147226_6_plen_82_part_00